MSDQMALEIPKRMMDCEDCGDVPFFSAISEEMMAISYLRMFHFFLRYGDFFGEKRSPREQVAVRLSSNHHS